MSAEVRNSTSRHFFFAKEIVLFLLSIHLIIGWFHSFDLMDGDKKLGECFSNLSMHPSPLEGFLKHRLLGSPTYISNEISRILMLLQGLHFYNHCFGG